MECPFCGSPMRLGTIRVRAYRHVDAAIERGPSGPSGRRGRLSRAVRDPARADTRPVVPPGLLSQGRRTASYCDRCGAVLAHPVRG